MKFKIQFQKKPNNDESGTPLSTFRVDKLNITENNDFIIIKNSIFYKGELTLFKRDLKTFNIYSY